jgi:phosphoglycolate phosphatase-like HAD superfamily hydrolase
LQKGTAKMPTLVRAFIFDVEGTLIDCVADILTSWEETLAQAGHRIGRATLQRYSGMDGAEMLGCLLPDVPEREGKAVLAEQGKRYRRDFIRLGRPFPFVRDLFALLKERRDSLGIATTCKRDELLICDRHMDVLALADAVASGDEATRGKPDPALYRLAIEKLGIAIPQTAMAVGDSPYDAIHTMRSPQPRLVFRAPVLLQEGSRGKSS